VLVAYEVLADYLDCVSERGAARGIENGRQLHRALVEAMAPETEMSDYYRYHSSGQDGGYARALVQRCRVGVQRLPSYEPMKPLLMRAAAHSGVLGLNHEPDPARREAVLKYWADDQIPAVLATALAADQQPAGRTGTPEHSWYERAAGSSAWVTVLAMLALAAEPGRAVGACVQGEQAARTYDAYVQWVAPAGAKLSSIADIAKDRASGDHSYVAHYPSIAVATQRIGELVRQSRREIRTLPGGAGHSVVFSSMIAFFLSKQSARAPELRASTRELRRAGGPLVGLLLPVLRLWRAAYGQRSA
jgi:tetraprenyl-beta-curcumene synthase